MRLTTAIAIVALLAGCVRSKNAADAIAKLDHRNVDVRRDAADDLRRFGVPSSQLETVLEHFRAEQDERVRVELMKALVETGDPQIAPVLEDYMLTADYDEQRHRSELYQRYMVTSGRYPRDDFRRKWPYDEPGYPSSVYNGMVWFAAPDPPRFTLKVELGVGVRRIYDTSLYALDFDNVLGARTRAGIWGVRMGMLQGATEGGRHFAQYRVGPYWELPFEHVRPSLMARLSYLDFARHTRSPGTMDAIGLGIHVGLAADLWRHELDHAVYLYGAFGVDGWFGDYALPGGAVGIGGRY
jgi:hypothetical protein